LNAQNDDSPAVQTAAGRASASPMVGRAGRVLAEISLIFIGVLLALALDSWREREAQVTTLQGLLSQVVDEVRNNRIACAEAIPFHRKAEAEYAAASELYRQEGRFEQPEVAAQGSRELRLSDAAFEALLNSSVVEQLPPDVLIKLSAVYQEQERYTARNQVYFATVLATDLMDGFRFFRLNQYWAGEMAEGEARLLQRYDALLSALPSELTALAPRG
jgi:hypothetical protein